MARRSWCRLTPRRLRIAVPMIYMLAAVITVVDVQIYQALQVNYNQGFPREPSDSSPGIRMPPRARNRRTTTPSPEMVYRQNFINSFRDMENMTTCPHPVTPDFINRTLSYVLQDLEKSKNLTENGVTGGKLNFSPNYRNPCWFERLPTIPFKYPPNYWTYLFRKGIMRNVTIDDFRHMTDVLNSRPSSQQTRLRCLPYVYMVGVYKSGTTDLFHSLSRHHQIKEPKIKEPGFWTTQAAPLSHYLDFYDRISEEIREEAAEDAFHPSVTLDATTGTFAGYALKNQVFPWGIKTKEECVTVQQHLKYLNPNTKIIIMLRNPIKWILSCYIYFQPQSSRPVKSAQQIHHRVSKGITKYNQCLEDTNNDEAYCYEQEWSEGNCKVQNTLYYFIVKPWVEQMGKDNVIVINSDEYFKDRLPTVQNVVNFLELDPLLSETADEIRNLDVVNPARNNTELYLMKETETLLQEFVQPYNKRLANYLNDATFNWQ